ncbi:DUF4377 domain-containing protein [Spirosoma rhododendri]|uniref:DUF4377 domain-containing protein n=1 Tax=Spirosoma rhododendri TaxID=2728024 RepID=A0A7L5DR09_9BACT|nr:DUF4377 domain-containing protein [Spirosoma rhododendri]QJD79891.1 DUF4377 domain-containing protein [Spirosoma rhododendri]
MVTGRVLTFVLLLAVIACEKRVGPEPPVRLTFQLDSKLGDCIILEPRKCFLVRHNDSERWLFMYEGIEGFSYEPGYRYTVEVWRQTLPNEGYMDALPYRYSLIRVIDKVKQ